MNNVFVFVIVFMIRTVNNQSESECPLWNA